MSTIAFLALIVGSHLAVAGIAILIAGWAARGFPGPSRDYAALYLLPGLMMVLPQLGTLIGGVSTLIFLVATVGCAIWLVLLNFRYADFIWRRRRRGDQRG